MSLCHFGFVYTPEPAYFFRWTFLGSNQRILLINLFVGEAKLNFNIDHPNFNLEFNFKLPSPTNIFGFIQFWKEKRKKEKRKNDGGGDGAGGDADWCGLFATRAVGEQPSTSHTVGVYNNTNSCSTRTSGEHRRKCNLTLLRALFFFGSGFGSGMGLFFGSGISSLLTIHVFAFSFHTTFPSADFGLGYHLTHTFLDSVLLPPSSGATDIWINTVIIQW